MESDNETSATANQTHDCRMGDKWCDLEHRLESCETKIEKCDTAIAECHTKIGKCEDALAALDVRIAAVETGMKEGFAKTHQSMEELIAPVLRDKVAWGDTLRQIAKWSILTILSGCAAAMGVTALKSILGSVK